jgi:hypothetical protein
LYGATLSGLTSCVDERELTEILSTGNDYRNIYR